MSPDRPTRSAPVSRAAFYASRNGVRTATDFFMTRAVLDVCFTGTAKNPRCALTWWLSRPASASVVESKRRLEGATDVRRGVSGLPDDLVFAAGAGKHRL